MTRIAFAAFAMFFVTIAPLSAAPVFAVLTRAETPSERRRTALKATFVATVLLTIFSVVGDDLLRLLGITLPAVRIGGGILLMLMAIRMVFGGAGGAADDAPKPQHGDVAVFPIAMPIIAGPATITAVIVLMSHHASLAAQLVVFGMLLLVLLLTLGLFLVAGAVEARLRGTPMTLITGVMGIILMALAAQFVVHGLRESLFR